LLTNKSVDFSKNYDLLYEKIDYDEVVIGMHHAGAQSPGTQSPGMQLYGTKNRTYWFFI
jgi:hypothetical protein